MRSTGREEGPTTIEDIVRISGSDRAKRSTTTITLHFQAPGN